MSSINALSLKHISQAFRTAAASVALAAKRTEKPQAERQTSGAKSSQALPNAYLGVSTIDPVALGAAFRLADNSGDMSAQQRIFAQIEEADPHVFAELQKRRMAVTGCAWHMLPPPNATDAELAQTQALQTALTNIPNFSSSLYGLTDAIGKGFSALEIEWQFGDVWLPKALHFVPQACFATAGVGQGQMGYQPGLYDYALTTPNGGRQTLNNYGWVMHQHQALSGYLPGQALFRVLAWAYAYKSYNIKDLQRFLEAYGMPLRLGKYPAGTQKEDRDALLRAVRNLGSDGAGIIPKDTLQNSRYPQVLIMHRNR